MPKIYEIYGTDAHYMTKKLMTESRVSDMIPADALIVLKPNLVCASTAETGATTHPGVLSGCIEYLQEAGFSDISVIEGSWVGEKTERAIRVCGYDRILEKYGIPFYDLKRDTVLNIETPFRTMEISERAMKAGFFIDLPVLKGHCQTLMTCALKNLKGCIPDSEKRRFHSDGLIKPIAALSSVLKPSLVIVDSICGDLYFEEGGNPIQTNRMMLGTDAVQIDAYGCSLMGLELREVPYIRLAEEWGAGSSEVRPEDIVKLNEPMESSGYPHLTGRVKSLTKNVTADSACSACFASLVRALYLAEKEGIKVREEISIGQGFKGKSINGTGIGRCCKDAKTHVNGCPPEPGNILDMFRMLH